ncbi:MAG: DUF359 domain-containing protein [Candidatus Nezhaarchaeales archaeon]
MRLKAYKVDENIRRELSKPWGQVITNEEIAAGELEKNLERMEARIILTVGDVTTNTFLERGIKPKVAIVDSKTLRGPYHVDLTSKMEVVAEVINPPGHVAVKAIEVISRVIERGGLVVVKGEEDLLVIPSILALPEGAVVAYGQPNVGVVLIKVDKDKKEKVKEVLRSMREVEVDDSIPS